MSVATALATGFEPSPALAEAAVDQALAKAGLPRAGGVLLYLSSHYSRPALAAPAVLAAARQAGCLQVFGMVAAGLFTESGWVLDQPAAAALVLGEQFALAAGSADGETPLLSLADSPALPADWREGPGRFGLLSHPAPIWQQARLAGQASIALIGGRSTLAISTGLRPLAAPQTVDQVLGHELLRVGGLSAVDSLTRALPPEMRDRPALPLHLLGVRRGGSGRPAIPLLLAQAEGSLTLAEPLTAGEEIQWTVRQPLAAEAEMREGLEQAAVVCPPPAFGLMFSCIGRGPLFYGGEDRDLRAFTERFPGTPLLGAYGSGQIAPQGTGNRQWQNCVVTALCEAENV